MSVEITTNADEFRRVMGLWLRNTSQELSKAINRRMFYVLARCYILAPPASPSSERAKIKAYLNEGISGVTHLRFVKLKKGETVARFKKASGSVLTRKNLIAQARAKRMGLKGLYGKAMRQAAGALASGAQGSVGFLKTPFARAIRQISGSFSAFGKVDKNTGQLIKNPNQALVKFAQDYGAGHSPADNTAIHKGAQATAYPAVPGLNPVSTSYLSYKFPDTGDKGRPSFLQNQAKAGQILAGVMSKALMDEQEEMRRHIQEVIDDAADRACLTSPNGRAG